MERKWISPLVTFEIGPNCGVPCAQLELLHAQSRDADLDRLIKLGHSPYKVRRVQNAIGHDPRCVEAGR